MKSDAVQLEMDEYFQSKEVDDAQVGSGGREIQHGEVERRRTFAQVVKPSLVKAMPNGEKQVVCTVALPKKDRIAEGCCKC